MDSISFATTCAQRAIQNFMGIPKSDQNSLGREVRPFFKPKITSCVAFWEEGVKPKSGKK